MLTTQTVTAFAFLCEIQVQLLKLLQGFHEIMEQSRKIVDFYIAGSNDVLVSYANANPAQQLETL